MQKKANITMTTGALRPYKKRLMLLWIGFFLIIFLAFDFSPFGGSIRFYSNWIACGVKPVETDYQASTGVKWYKQSSSFQVSRFGYITYFCAPLKAEEAGYSANPSSYEFPNLNKAN